MPVRTLGLTLFRPTVMQNTTTVGTPRTRPRPRWSPRPPSLRRAPSSCAASTAPASDVGGTQPHGHEASKQPERTSPVRRALRVEPDAPAATRRLLDHPPQLAPQRARGELETKLDASSDKQGAVQTHELTLPSDGGAVRRVQVTFTYFEVTENQEASHMVHVISLVDQEGQEWVVPIAQRDEFAAGLLSSFLAERSSATR